MSEEFIDLVYVCMYCGDLMEKPSEKMLTLFGEGALNCCELPMVKVERNKIYQVVKAVDKLKENLEKEILKGML